MTRRPLAYVDPTGYVVPNPTFTDESIKHMPGRFIYTQADLTRAIEDMNRRTEERRQLADQEYGADVVSVPSELTYEEASERLAGTRETVPSFDQPSSAKKKRGGPSQKLTMPNVAPLPETLHVEPVQYEEGEAPVGINAGAVAQAMFGSK